MSKTVAALAVALFLLPSMSASAAEPEDKHAALQKERAEVQARFRQAVTAQAAAVEGVSRATKAFRGCKNTRLQILADPVLHRAEVARRTLESGRRGTEALRKELEGRRAGLESERRYRGKVRDPEYVAGEVAYADGMSERYLKPLASMVVPQIEGYNAGIADYAKVLESYAEFCARPGYTGAGAAVFVNELQASVDALSGRSEQYAKAVSEARMSSEKAHAAAP